MKLVIEILDEQYEFIKKEAPIFLAMQYPALMSDICERIKNGISLKEELKIKERGRKNDKSL